MTGSVHTTNPVLYIYDIHLMTLWSFDREYAWFQHI